MDDELLEQQRAAYAVQGVDENEPVGPKQKKRKQEYTNGEDVSEFYQHLRRPFVWTRAT